MRKPGDDLVLATQIITRIMDAGYDPHHFHQSGYLVSTVIHPENIVKIRSHEFSLEDQPTKAKVLPFLTICDKVHCTVWYTRSVTYYNCTAFVGGPGYVYHRLCTDNKLNTKKPVPVIFC